MRKFLVLLILVTLGCTVGVESDSNPTNTTSVAQRNGNIPLLPRSDLTPGMVDPRVTQANIHETICVPGYSTSVRPSVRKTNRLKDEALAAYGISDPPSLYEGDHLISLSLGGEPLSITNYWPEAWETPKGYAPKGLGAQTKDRFENYLYRQVCSNAITLAEAQNQIRTDWYQAWVLAGKP